MGQVFEKHMRVGPGESRFVHEVSRCHPAFFLQKIKDKILYVHGRRPEFLLTTLL
jgi:hypothetical protein